MNVHPEDMLRKAMMEVAEKGRKRIQERDGQMPTMRRRPDGMAVPKLADATVAILADFLNGDMATDMIAEKWGLTMKNASNFAQRLAARGYLKGVGSKRVEFEGGCSRRTIWAITQAGRDFLKGEKQ